jgi:hypothetical protein
MTASGSPRSAATGGTHDGPVVTGGAGVIGRGYAVRVPDDRAAAERRTWSAGPESSDPREVSHD